MTRLPFCIHEPFFPPKEVGDASGSNQFEVWRANENGDQVCVPRSYVIIVFLIRLAIQGRLVEIYYTVFKKHRERIKYHAQLQSPDFVDPSFSQSTEPYCFSVWKIKIKKSGRRELKKL